jgi:hypothetical protein
VGLVADIFTLTHKTKKVGLPRFPLRISPEP